MPNYKIGKRCGASTSAPAAPPKVARRHRTAPDAEHFRLIRLLADCCDVRLDADAPSHGDASPLCDSVPTYAHCSEEIESCVSTDLVKVKVEPGIEMQLKQSSSPLDHSSMLVGSGAEMSGCKLSELVRPLEEVRLPLICVKAFKGEVQETVAPPSDAAADCVRPVRLFRCSECEHMFASHKQLLEHVRGNTADPSLKVLYRHKCGFFCPQCKTRLLNHKSLLLHQAQKHGAEAAAVGAAGRSEGAAGALVGGAVCGICSKQVSCGAEMAAHMAAHDKFMPFECRKCHTRFKLHAQLKAHHALTHEVAKDPRGWYLCKLCDAAFKKLVDYKAHTMHDHCVRFDDLYSITKRF